MPRKEREVREKEAGVPSIRRYTAPPPPDEGTLAFIREEGRVEEGVMVVCVVEEKKGVECLLECVNVAVVNEEEEEEGCDCSDGGCDGEEEEELVVVIGVVVMVDDDDEGDSIRAGFV